MCRGQASRRNTPTIVLQKQGCLGLDARKAELSGIAWKPPSCVIFTQGFQALGDLPLVEPFDLVSLAAAYVVEAFWSHELDSTRAVFADVGDESEYVTGRHVEFGCPSTKHAFVIGQQTP